MKKNEWMKELERLYGKEYIEYEKRKLKKNLRDNATIQMEKEFADAQKILMKKESE